MTRTFAALLAAAALALGCAAPPAEDSRPAPAPEAEATPAPAPAAAADGDALAQARAVLDDLPATPHVVMVTEKGTIEFDLFAEDAPVSVAQIVTLIGRNFYNGQRVHRVDEGSLIQWGDPQSRDMRLANVWGTLSSGRPIGVAEISPEHGHVPGAVALAHPGDPRRADSQLYITMVPRPELDSGYAVIGMVTSGMDVVAQIEVGDRIESMTVEGMEPTGPQFQGLGQ